MSSEEEFYHAKKQFYPGIRPLSDFMNNAGKKDIYKQIRIKHNVEQKKIINGIINTLKPLRKKGVEFVFSKKIFYDHSLSFFPLVVSVKDPCFAEKSFIEVLKLLFQVKELVHYYCLIPTYQGNRFTELVWRINSDNIADVIDNLENQVGIDKLIFPTEIPDWVHKVLPSIPYKQYPKLEFYSHYISLFYKTDIINDFKEINDSFRSSDNKFSKKLFLRNQEKINNDIKTLKNDACEIINEMDRFFSEKKGEKYFGNIYRFLEEYATINYDNVFKLNASVQYVSENDIESLLR